MGKPNIEAAKTLGLKAKINQRAAAFYRNLNPMVEKEKP